MEALMAEVIGDLIDPGRYDERGFSWYAMGIRSRHVNWHLSDPANDSREQATFRRTGWLATAGKQARICLCGPTERVDVVAFNEDDRFGTLPMTDELNFPAFLSELGMRVTLLQREGDVADYEIQPPGQFPARLRIRGSCTSPMSRAAQRCWTDYTLVLEPNADGPAIDRAELCGRQRF